ncbi:MAG: class I SAM-dependent methyltransferase [Planctomycetota bacterium]
MSWQVPEPWRARVDAVAPPRFADLTPRLAALALAVPEGARVADIGADHGLLGRALLATGRAAHVVAVDLSPAALEGARKNLAPEVAAGRASVRLGDGFRALEPGTIDCAVLAGMGARNIIEIVAAAVATGHTPERLVIQALAGEHRVRVALLEAGYGLIDEHLVADGRRVFMTLVLQHGAGVRALLDDVERYVGPHLVRRRDALLDAWLDVQAAWLEAKVQALCALDDEHARAARARLAAIHGAREARPQARA